MLKQQNPKIVRKPESWIANDRINLIRNEESMQKRSGTSWNEPKKPSYNIKPKLAGNFSASLFFAKFINLL